MEDKKIQFSNQSFYVLDLFKRFLDVKNLPIAIYVLINMFLVGIGFMLVGMDSQEHALQMFAIGILVYFASLVLALSPVGEWVLRIQNGCEKIEDKKVLERIKPLFEEVYEKAKQEDPSVPEGVKLYMKYESTKNAFATGRKTVCIMSGLLDEKDDEVIKAVLAHEFGHLAHKDTDLILLVSVGNLFVSVILVLIRLFIAFVHFMVGLALAFTGKEGWGAAIANGIANMMTLFFITVFEWMWTKLGVLLVMKSSRDMEYKADEFSMKLGYGNSLCELLDSFQGKPEEGFFANLMSSHPDNDKRIAHLQELGCTYVKKEPTEEPGMLETFVEKLKKIAIRVIAVIAIILFVGAIVTNVGNAIANSWDDGASYEDDFDKNQYDNNEDSFISSNDDKDDTNKEDDIGDADDETITLPSNQDSANSSQDNKVPRDVVFFNKLSDYTDEIGTLASKEIKETIDAVRYAETDDYIMDDAIYVMERKQNATQSEYVAEIYDSAVLVISKYLNTKTNEEKYAYCVIPNVSVENNRLNYDADEIFVRLENSIEQIADFVRNDTGYDCYPKLRAESFIEELEKVSLMEGTLLQQIIGKQAFVCDSTEGGFEMTLFVGISDDRQTAHIISGDGLINITVTYAHEASDSTLTTFYAYEDGKEFYNKLKEARRDDLVAKYAHIENMTSDQLEKCQIEIFYAHRKGEIEFKAIGPYEFYNGVYTTTE